MAPDPEFTAIAGSAPAAPTPGMMTWWPTVGTRTGLRAVARFGSPPAAATRVIETGVTCGSHASRARIARRETRAGWPVGSRRREEGGDGWACASGEGS